MMRQRVAIWIGLLVIMGGILVQSYNGRADLVRSQRKQCEVAILAKHANMEAWYAAYLSRTRDYHLTHIAQYRQSAGVYLTEVKVANSLVNRANSLVWPDPAVTDAHGPFAHPLGYGHFSCVTAFPSPSPFQLLS